MAQILSLISSKGGVGKSTFVINFSSALADMGLRVLVVDLDSQQSLSKFFKYATTPTKGLLEFIIKKDTTTPVETHIPNLHCIVNNDPLETLNKWMDEEFSGCFALNKVLKRLQDNYDIIIIDTQGKDGRGQLQEMALVASDIVITPTTPDVMSSQELPKAIRIYDHVVKGLEDIGVSSQPPTLKILINRLDNTIETKTVTAEIRKNFSNIAKHITVLKTAIPSRVVYRKCISHQIPAHHIEKKSIEGGQEAVDILESLVHEILPHYEDLSLSAEVQNG
ncbi:MAG: ParA family protein [Gammaproteobacteria bacterium]|nr:ParA family protein [Gammaproteobacteria bacterium]